MQVCQHRPFECLRVSYRSMSKCITNFNRSTTVAHVIDALLDDLSEKQNLSTNDCCLYVERPPYLFPLKTTEFIQDILLRYASSDIQFKLSFKRTSSPSRFAQRKKLLRTPVQTPAITNAYEQLKIQESLIRRQHDIICRLRQTTLSDERTQNNPSTSSPSSANYANYFDWVTQKNSDDVAAVDSDDSRTSSDIIPVCRRQSRQDDYQTAGNRETMTNSNRSLSRVRFRSTTQTTRHEIPSSSMTEVKSILKNASPTYSGVPRGSSVDRNIARLVSLNKRRNSLYACDDDNLSDQSTTDSCLGSLSSNDSNSYIVSQQQLETLV